VLDDKKFTAKCLFLIKILYEAFKIKPGNFSFYSFVRHKQLFQTAIPRP